MNVLDLFSNIGGHAIGLGIAGGFRVVQFVEIDPRRQRLLAYHFPGVPIHDDVRTFAGAGADVVIGGPPCQQTSVAAAIHDKRTGESLWPEMLRIGIDAGAKWSWSSPRAMRLGKPKSREVWRTLASTVPELNLRLATLVRLISAGECSFLPTPVSRDFRSPGKPSHKRLTESRGQPLPETLGMRVHPEVCEWLMGLPVGWTEMLPSRQLEMPTLPQWPQLSAGQS